MLVRSWTIKITAKYIQWRRSLRVSFWKLPTFFSFFKFLHNWVHIYKDALSKTVFFLFIPGSKSCLHSWNSTFYAAGRNHSLVKEIQVSMNLLIRMPFKSTEQNISNTQLLVLPLGKAHKQPEEVLDFIYALLSSKIERKKPVIHLVFQPILTHSLWQKQTSGLKYRLSLHWRPKDILPEAEEQDTALQSLGVLKHINRCFVEPDIK